MWVGLGCTLNAVEGIDWEAGLGCCGHGLLREDNFREGVHRSLGLIRRDIQHVVQVLVHNRRSGFQAVENDSLLSGVQIDSFL